MRKKWFKTLFASSFLVCLLMMPLPTNGQQGINSLLETIDIGTYKRSVVWEDQDLIEAPNWPDREHFIVNSKGHLYRIYPGNGKKVMINTGFANRCNNDHGVSPDGTMLVISNQDSDNGDSENWKTSKIYLLPASGGEPKLVTPKSPSFWHGWSPDGTQLVYTALRNDRWDLYRICVSGGDEKRLTNEPGLDDGPEYSPDGKYVYYNSFQSGSIEIWRMKQDGSEKTQLTRDPHSNWFPHPSPDGNLLVFLSYLEDQGESHPFGKQVKLRIMDLETHSITDLTDSFFGGQGTINVNSWSPDGNQVAFVRYQERK
jgi:Tol biopolymer transport system component